MWSKSMLIILDKNKVKMNFKQIHERENDWSSSVRVTEKFHFEKREFCKQTNHWPCLFIRLISTHIQWCQVELSVVMIVQCTFLPMNSVHTGKFPEHHCAIYETAVTNLLLHWWITMNNSDHNRNFLFFIKYL